MIYPPEIQQAEYTRQSDASSAPGTGLDRDAVLEQLNRLLASSVFRSSKRVSGLLRYVVEQTLENGGTELKERTIGVNVFGRSPDYDTGAEPVVRVSAGDLRKRIAQYYHDSARADEIRIDLPTGSYRPVFHLPALAPTVVAQPVDIVREETPRRTPYLIAAGVLVVIAAITALVATQFPGNAYEQFWGPVVAEQGPVLIYAGGRPGEDRIVFEDAIAMVELSGNLRARNKPFRILRETELSPDTLKQGPSLLIGGFSNPLARRLTQQLRFAFATDGDIGTNGSPYIQDRQNLTSRLWSMPPNTSSASGTFTDYAIVSRVFDPVTNRIAVTSAGVKRSGTRAAAEFLSHPEQIEALAAQGPRDWRKKNMQAVLAVLINQGKASPAHVVATYFW